MSDKIAVLGECMLELRSENLNTSLSKQPMQMGYGGDTLNTAVYLSRNGCEVSYFTALGSDPMSAWLIEEWQKENIDCEHVIRMPNSVPGMYMINLAEDGERSFFYWRKNSPASRMFDVEAVATKIFSQLAEYKYLYLSGISLAILPESSQQRLLAFLADYKQCGGNLVFDGNYRPNLWADPERTKTIYKQMYALSKIVLPTFDDEQSLFGFREPDELLSMLKNSGVAEVVLKMGGDGCLASYGDEVVHVPAKLTRPVDTTAAGDSFNAGYLAARLFGRNVTDSCVFGHELASQVVSYRGAIIPSDAMPNPAQVH